jgi:hypothetical protein
MINFKVEIKIDMIILNFNSVHSILQIDFFLHRKTHFFQVISQT